MSSTHSRVSRDALSNCLLAPQEGSLIAPVCLKYNVAPILAYLSRLRSECEHVNNSPLLDKSLEMFKRDEASVFVFMEMLHFCLFVCLSVGLFVDIDRKEEED